MSPTLIRRAEAADLEAIVRIFMADDQSGHVNDWNETSRPGYERAMAAILASPVNRLYVVVAGPSFVPTGRAARAEGGAIIGTFQLTLTPGLVGGGRTRATLESVHVRPEARGQGIGSLMVAHARAEARAAGARILQLTSNKKRPDAHRFYERLGFSPSHEGFKLPL
jgi:GNAT superfamily N-acetyltransferase